MKSISSITVLSFIFYLSIISFYSCDKAVKKVAKEITEEGFEKSTKKRPKKFWRNLIN